MYHDTSLTWLYRITRCPQQEDWEKLVCRYGPLLRRWAARSGVPSVDQDDIVQEVLWVVARRISSFERRRPGAFRGWLRKILGHQILKYYRSVARHSYVTQIDFNSIARSADTPNINDDNRHYRIQNAMRIIRHDFSGTTWRAFELQVLHDLSAQNVATMLGVSVNSVIKAKSRVMRRLRQAIGTP